MSALPRLHVTTDDEVLMDEAFVTRALAAVEAGGKDIALHVRGRSATAARRYEVAIALRATCERLGARLLVNDRGRSFRTRPGASLPMHSLGVDRALWLGLMAGGARSCVAGRRLGFTSMSTGLRLFVHKRAYQPTRRTVSV